MTDVRQGGSGRLSGRRQVRTFASLSAATQGEAVLSFLGVVVLVRVAGVQEAGAVFLAQSLASLWFLFSDPRLDDAAQRFAPLHEASAPGWGTWLFLRLYRFDAIVGTVTAAIGAGGALLGYAAGWTGGHQALLLILAMAANGVTASAGTISVGFALAGQLGRFGLLRLVSAGCSFVVTMAALVTGGTVAFLAATAAAGLVTTAVLLVAARRAVTATLGPPASGPVPMPRGLVPFAVKSSAATSVAFGMESGVLVFAGLLGGPQLVTLLKVAGSPARFFGTLVSPVATQMYPQLTAAAIRHDGAEVRRSAYRASALVAVLGVVTVSIAVPLVGPLLGLVYGSSFAPLGTVALVLVAAAAVRSTAVWSKVLALAVGRPEIRLAFVAAEGLLTLGALVLATRLAAGSEDAALAFAQGSLVVAVLGTATWLLMLRPLTRWSHPPAGPSARLTEVAE